MSPDSVLVATGWNLRLEVVAALVLFVPLMMAVELFAMLLIGMIVDPFVEFEEFKVAFVR